MTALDLFADALALKGLTIADARKISTLTPGLKRHAKWSMRYAQAQAARVAREEAFRREQGDIIPDDVFVAELNELYHQVTAEIAARDAFIGPG